MPRTPILCRLDYRTVQFEANLIDRRGNALILDQTAFYPAGGGQPCDTGRLDLGGQSLEVVDVRWSDGGLVEHVVAGELLPEVAPRVIGHVDPVRRTELTKLITASMPRPSPRV